MKHPRRFRIALGLALGAASVLAANTAAAADLSLDANTCEKTLGGAWAFDQHCTVRDFSLGAPDTLTVPAPLQLVLEGTCRNEGDITIDPGASLVVQAGAWLDNRAEIVIEGWFENSGTFENTWHGGLVNQGRSLNQGHIVNLGSESYLENLDGFFNNYGLIKNLSPQARITNTFATLRNREGGVIEIAGGVFTNEHEGIVTNVSGARIEVLLGADFVNSDDSLFIEREPGAREEEGSCVVSFETTVGAQGSGS